MGTRVTTFLLIHHILCILAAENNNNCRSYKGSRPHIWPLSSAQSVYGTVQDPRRTSIRDDDGLLSNTILSTFTQQRFNCSFNRPVHWVFHLDMETTMTLEIDFSERLQMFETGNGSALVRYNYSSNFRLLYLESQLEHGMLLSCEPIPLLDKCERSFIQTNPFNSDFEDRPVVDANPSLDQLSKDLLTSSTTEASPRFANWEECPVRLYLQTVAGRVILYKWEKKGNSADMEYPDPMLTNETTYFDNFLRLNHTREKHCVRTLPDNETCAGCKSAEEYNYTINAAIFYAEYENVLMVFKGFFSVPDGNPANRMFYMDWETSGSGSTYDNMIQLNLPEKVIVSKEIEVTCRVSIFLFAYGTKITDKSSPDNETVQSEEFFTIYGYRDVKRRLKFNTPNENKTITCFAPLKRSDNWKYKAKTFFVEDATLPRIDNSSQSFAERRVILAGSENVSAECNASGHPIPMLSWINIPKNLTDRVETIKEDNFMQIVFPKWERDFDGTYICEAKNAEGVTTKAITFYTKNEGESSNTVVIAVSSLGAFSCVMGILIGILLWRIRQQRLAFEKQTQKAIQEFRDGLTIELANETDAQNPNFNVHQLPFNNTFEIARNKWDIAEKVLGSGQFGIVRMGTVLTRGESVKVAVKTLKSAVDIDDFKSFLFELKIMAYLGQHKNIVSLVGSCIEGINEREILIGVEFCDNGCLLDYLRKYRPTFQNMVTSDGKIMSDASMMLEECSQYANISCISTRDLFRWAYHIACGMDYLRIKQVLHGDLAARNVLLSSRKVAKVGDFGLSRVLMNSENYNKTSNVPLPWKWMAIESLRSRVFSTNTDVWSYGVVLYELFTLGQSPYPGIAYSPKFVTELENGMRMGLPVFCTTSLYKVMKACWESDPHQRPNYAKIKRKLSKGLTRLSALVIAQEQLNNNNSNSRRNRTQAQPTTHETPRVTQEIEEEETNHVGVYANLHRGTIMNYYTNNN